jgi:hypothetical protein
MPLVTTQVEVSEEQILKKIPRQNLTIRAGSIITVSEGGDTDDDEDQITNRTYILARDVCVYLNDDAKVFPTPLREEPA